MRKRLLTVLLFLVAPASLAWGQAPSGNSVAQTPPSTPHGDDNGLDVLKGLKSVFSYHGDLEPSGEGEEHGEEEAPKADRLFVHTDFLLWRLKVMNIPTLVTSGPYTDPQVGALTSPATKTLFGGSGLDFQDRSGGRITLGWYLDDTQTWSVQASYFCLAGRPAEQSFTSSGSPVLAVPFTNANTGVATSSVVAYPGIASGTVAVEAPSFLQSAEANLSAVLWKSEHFHLEGLAGFRYVGLNEGLHIEQSSLIGLAPQYQGMGIPFNGNTITVTDLFDTRNSFYGGQAGMKAEFTYKRWSVEVWSKVALGVSNETVSVHGATGINTTPAVAAPGGQFAVSSNSGQYSRDPFAVVPEVGVNFGFQLTDHIRLVAGYSFLYWSSVARPGDQVDTSVNPNLVPTSNTFGTPGGAQRPAFAFHSTDFFAHGVNLGMEFRY